MIRIRISSCSCFIEKVLKCSFEDIFTNSELFIKEIREERLFLDTLVIYTEYVIACLDCFTFQLWNLSIENIGIFDSVDCRFTFSDPFLFGEEYYDDVCTGNRQFDTENALLSFDERQAIFRKRINTGDLFFRQPSHKSCFTSLDKLKYEFFCTNCKKIYSNFFEKQLHVFYILKKEK